MDYDSSTSCDTELNSSNIISLPGGENAVSRPLPTMPVKVKGNRLPEGYFAESNGIYFQNQNNKKEEDDDDEGPVWICSPIAVVGLSRRPDGRGWSRVVEVVDSDCRTHRLLLDEMLFNGAPSALLRPLLDCGLQVETGAPARSRVADLLGAWRSDNSFVRASNVGWVDKDFDTFAFADGTIVGRKKAILDRDTGIIGEMGGISGSLKDWRETVGAACVGNPLMLLAVSQAFVGPLLGPLGMDGGGFHFLGASSRGKTTLLSMAASVWGAPKFVQSWRTTDNAMENVASCCSSALLALDELHMASPKFAGDIVYMLANGRGKQRMAANGKGKSTDSWLVATLSSGEITLEDHLDSGGKKTHAGQKVRLIDIEADGRRFGSFDVLHGETDSGRFVDKLMETATRNHGHASRIFVEKLIGNMDHRDIMTKLMDSFMDQAIKAHDLGHDSQVRRVLKRFALAATAGELATSFGLTGWERGEAFRGILNVVGFWIMERDVASASLVTAALDRTRTYLAAHSDRFVPCGASGDVDGWRDGTFFFFRPETWSRIHGVDGALEAARLHKAANMLRTDRGETLQLKMGRSVPGRPKAYAVNVGVLDA